MNGSRTIRVRKRDGGDEPFQALKLAGMMWRGMRTTCGGFRDARDLAEAVEIHLLRTGQHRVTSEAVFDMAMRVLRRVRMGDAATVLENHRLWRHARRTGLLLYHGYGDRTRRVLGRGSSARDAGRPIYIETARRPGGTVAAATVVKCW